VARVLDPLIQALVRPVLDDAVEPVEQIARPGEIWRGLLVIAIVRVTVFDGLSRSSVIMRAMRRADGASPGRLPRVSTPSSFRFRVVHSVTTRSPPVNPATFIARQSAAPLWQPSANADLPLPDRLADHESEPRSRAK
jgi:hypothetical protein